MKKQRIVSFDLDHTLVDHKTWEIPESALEALEELRESCKIVIASGRDMNAPFSRGYRDQIKPDAIIHLNGTRITVGKKDIYDHTFPAETLRRIMKYAEEKGYGVGTSVDGKDYYINPERMTANDLRFFGKTDRHYQPVSLMPVKKVRMLHFIGSMEEAEDLEERFPEVRMLIFADKCGADIVERSSSKAAGLRRLCQYYRIPIEDTVAFGDSMNDCEIIREAGIGVAMGNATPELKATADYVTDDIDKDGIWKACKHLGLF